jgi:hypothetical protein
LRRWLIKCWWRIFCNNNVSCLWKGLIRNYLIIIRTIIDNLSFNFNNFYILLLYSNTSFISTT